MNRSGKRLSIFLFSILLAGCSVQGPPSSAPEPADSPGILSPAPESEAGEAINLTDLPLELPDRFKVEILTDQMPGARVLAGPDSQGRLWASRTSPGVLSTIALGPDGNAGIAKDELRNLSSPHGLAFDPQDHSILYVAEERRISRFDTDEEKPELEKVIDLPAGGRHFTRTLLFGPDDRLYVSIGSSCDVCDEKDERHAAIYSMNRDGTDFKPYATGLRNSVFMAIHPVTGGLWASEMGRDRLGDDLPPDEINILKAGGDYGWPHCYGKNIQDESFISKKNDPEACAGKIPSHVDLQAHSAPLGLAFVPEEGWPEEYWHDLLVAYHGSWNRSELTGYSIMRIDLDAEGNELGQEPFITGWLNDGEKLGRPVDILLFPGGIMYVTDDKKGAVYRVTYQNPDYIE